MNNKIKNYVDVLFTDVPRSKKSNELKEELLSNLVERFDDYMREGKTENQAYSLAVSNMGDIDELLSAVMPDADFKKEANFYRKRNARNTAIGVSMYILGAAALIGLGALGEFMGYAEVYGTIGLLILLVLCAIATGLIIYTNMSTPQEYKDYDEDAERERKIYSNPKNGVVAKGVMSIYWSLITLIYLGISFATMRWDITWLIWILAAVLGRIIELIFEMVNCDEK